MDRCWLVVPRRHCLTMQQNTLLVVSVIIRLAHCMVTASQHGHSVIGKFTSPRVGQYRTGCPPGWTGLSDLCYFVDGFTKGGWTYQDAVERCWLAGGKLSAVSTKYSVRVLAKYIRETMGATQDAALFSNVAVWVATEPDRLVSRSSTHHKTSWTACRTLILGAQALGLASCTEKRAYVCQTPRIYQPTDLHSALIEEAKDNVDSVRGSRGGGDVRSDGFPLKQLEDKQTERVEEEPSSLKRMSQKSRYNLVGHRRLLSVNTTTTPEEETSTEPNYSLSNFLKQIQEIRATASFADLGQLKNFVLGHLQTVGQYLEDIRRDASMNTTNLNDVRNGVLSLVKALSDIGIIIQNNIVTTQFHASVGDIKMLVMKSSYDAFEGFVFETNGADDSVSITVPKDARSLGMGGVVAFVFPNVETLFQDAGDPAQLSSPLAMCSMFSTSGQEMALQTLVPITIRYSNGAPATVADRQMVACKVLLLDGAGLFSGWSEDGCVVARHQGTEVVCQCNHLSTFGTILQPTLSVGHVQYLSLIGCAFTSLCCMVTLMTLIGYRLLDSTRSYVRISFLIALSLTEAIFLAGSRFSDVPAVCTMVALVLHFTTLACFTWLLSYSLLLGTEMRTTNPYNRIMTFSVYTAIGWGVPGCVAIITIIWRNTDYRNLLFCWVSSENFMYLSILVPLCVTALITWGILFVVIHIYRRMKDLSVKTLVAFTWSGIRSCLLLNPLLIGTWVSAAFTITHNAIWVQVLFAVFNIALGITVFLFMCFWNEEVRMARVPKKSIPVRDYTVSNIGKSKVEPMVKCCHLGDGVQIHSVACRTGVGHREPPATFSSSVWMVASSGDTTRENEEAGQSDLKREDRESRGKLSARSDSCSQLIPDDQCKVKDENESTF